MTTRASPLRPRRPSRFADHAGRDPDRRARPGAGRRRSLGRPARPAAAARRRRRRLAPRRRAGAAPLCRADRRRRGSSPAAYAPDRLRAAIASGNEARAHAGRRRRSSCSSPPISAAARCAAAAGSTGTCPMPASTRPASSGCSPRCMRGGGVGAALDSLLPTHPQYAGLKRALADTPESDDRAPRPHPHQHGALALAAAQPRRAPRAGQRARLHRRPGRRRPGHRPPPHRGRRAPHADAAAQRDDHRGHDQSLVERAAEHHPREWRQLRRRLSGARATASGISVRQPPGPRNALGRVKIEMPNEHAIYLHDTPSQALFGRPVRAFSHGCIRTQNVRDFAALLLAPTGEWDRAAIDRGDRRRAATSRSALAAADPGLHRLFHRGRDQRRQHRHLWRHLRPRRAGPPGAEPRRRAAPQQASELATATERRRGGAGSSADPFSRSRAMAASSILLERHRARRRPSRRSRGDDRGRRRDRSAAASSASRTARHAQGPRPQGRAGRGARGSARR